LWSGVEKDSWKKARNRGAPKAGGKCRVKKNDTIIKISQLPNNKRQQGAGPQTEKKNKTRK